MTQVQLPCFWFRVDAMDLDEEQIIQPIRTGNTEIPPRAFGGNTIDTSYPIMPPDTVMFFDGRLTPGADPAQIKGVQSTASPMPPWLRGVDPVQCYSVFVMEDSVIQTVPMDATASAVHDDFQPDWEVLQFKEVSQGRTMHSYAAYNAGEVRLCAQPRGTWLAQLLPDRHWPVGAARRRAGGLSGHIALLVALLALTVPDQHVAGALRLCMGARWRCFPASSIDASEHRTPYRGVVVKIWRGLPQQGFRPGESQEDGIERMRGERRQWDAWFSAYQAGQFGVMFE